MMQQGHLVRDNVVDILEKKGKNPKYHIAGQAEYRKKLKDKLKSEVSDYINDGSPEELADILEAVYAIAEMDGVSRKKLDSLRSKKAEYKGTFEKRIILESPQDPYD